MGTALHECHSTDPGRELAFFEPFFSSEPGEPAYGFDVFSRIVFARWRPSIYYVFYTYGFVFSSVGIEDAESRSNAIFDARELHELPIPGPLSVLRRDWVVAPLCEAGATFSGSSKDLSRPL